MTSTGRVVVFSIARTNSSIASCATRYSLAIAALQIDRLGYRESRTVLRTIHEKDGPGTSRSVFATRRPTEKPYDIDARTGRQAGGAHGSVSREFRSPPKIAKPTPASQDGRGRFPKFRLGHPENECLYKGGKNRDRETSFHAVYRNGKKIARNRNKKPRSPFDERGFIFNPAASYFPTPSRVQYHRPWRA